MSGADANATEAPQPTVGGGSVAGEVTPGGERAAVLRETHGAMSRSAFMLGAKVLIWGLAFVMTIMLPRYLGPQGFGQLYFAISLTSIFTIFVEFGLNSLVTREVARNRGEATRYLVNAALVKSGLWVVAFAAMTTLVHVLGYARPARMAVMVLGGGILFTSLATLLVAVLQANDRIRWAAMSSILEKAVYVALGVVALLLGYGVVAIAIVMLVGYVAGFLLDLWWFRRLAGTTETHVGWRGLEVAGLLKRALPFFSMAILGAVYFRIDVLMLSLLTNDSVVGWYGVAYHLFQTTYFLPEAFMFSMFPVLCRLSKEGGGSLAMGARKSVDLLLLVGVPIAVGTFVLADEIIATLYGMSQYANSVAVLRVLSFAVVLMYCNSVFVQSLIALDRQKRLVITAGAAAVFNVALNLLLIPRFGAVGAAITTVLTEALVICLNFAFLPRSLMRLLWTGTVLRAAASAAVMAVPLVLLGGRSLGLLLPVGVATYLIAVVVLRALPAEDWLAVKAAVRMRRDS